MHFEALQKQYFYTAVRYGDTRTLISFNMYSLIFEKYLTVKPDAPNNNVFMME
jgi:hypothetical protein